MPSCSKGKIRKSGYTTKKGVKVPSTCIQDKGAKGKGKKLFTLKDKGMLTKHGYSLKKSYKERTKAIDKTVYSGKSALEVQQHLVAIRTLHKGDNTKTHEQKLTRDIKYIQKMRK